MARGLSSTIKTYLENQSQIKVGLVEINTASSTVYYTDAPFDIDYNSNTYQAQGNWLGVSDIEENTDLVITRCSLRIGGLVSANISTFAQSSIINKSVILYTAFLNPTNNTIVGTPIITFQGKVTGYSVLNAANTASIQLEVSSLFANFEKTTGRRTNTASFQREHPTDFGMAFSHETTEGIQWGVFGND